MFHGSWVLTGAFVFIALAIVIAGVAWFDRNTDNPEKPYDPATASPARRELEERFARGEMDEIQYMKARTELHE